MEIETKPKPKQHYASITRIRHLAMYQPPVPMRCVWVAVHGDDGEVEQIEEAVLGMQAVVRDVYGGCKVKEAGNWHVPSAMTSKAIMEAGYTPEEDNQEVEHALVIFCSQWDEMLALTPDRMSKDDWRRVIGPKDAPAEWWERQIADAIRILKGTEK
jgi:hypothetical protein